MCGIAGIIRKEQRVDKDEVVRMCSFLQERGPDNTGFFLKDNIGFGHTRLSIIDPSEDSNQPMLTDDERIVISFNGEIYNFGSLKSELKDLGCSFKTKGDTEVLINGYQAWGMDILLKKLDGMFAFSLIDFNINKVFFARDPFGKKPLYLLLNSSEWLFSSSINSIWELKKSELSLNLETVDYFLTEVSSPQPSTVWREIEQLRPACFLELDLTSWKFKEKSYWKLQPLHYNYSENEALEVIEEHLIKAISKRRVSDVAIGCFLSGGIDSGLITSILATISTDKIKTFSVGFGDPSLDELEDARIVARRYDTDHHEIIIDSEGIDILPSLIEYIGEPFADMSMIPTYYISNYVGRNVKVVLSGDGGDELFGGYNDYLLSAEAEFFDKKYKSSFPKSLAIIKDKIESRFQHGRRNLGSLNEYNLRKPYQRLYRGIGFSIEEKYKILNQGMAFTKDFLNMKWNSTRGASSETEHLMLTSLETRLLNSYLVKVDRMSMINSLEVRSPFLDKELAKVAYSLPTSLKFKNGISKYFLKRLGEKYMDPKIQKRPKKGFSVPMYDWFLSNRKWASEIVLSNKMNDLGLFNRANLEKLMTNVEVGNVSKVWSLVCLGLWLDRFK
ncbi:MAG: asparagine synthase (glutamine-hydrolyzing) [Cyclobacteriaceae bacterium]